MISLKLINFKDTTFKISFPDIISKNLVTSIKQVGILYPIILRQLPKSNTYQIVSGFRRMKIAQKLKKTHIPAHIHKANTLSDRDAFLLSFFDNTGIREFNTMEKSILLDKLSYHDLFSEKEIIANFLPVLGIDANRFMFERLIKLRSLPHTGQISLAEDRISLAAAELILHFPPSERSPLIALLNTITRGKHKAETILNLLFDITKRERCGIQHIFSSAEFKEILTNKKSSGTDKYHAIRNYLYNRRYPRLSHIQLDIAEDMRALNLPGSIKLNPPAFLEGDSLKLETHIKNKHDLSACIKALQHLLKNPALTSLLNKL